MNKFLTPVALAGAAAALSLGLGTGAGVADARISAGPLTLSVKGTCSAPGDSIKEFYVWTPENGKKRATSGKSATHTFQINKKKMGDTYFNWKLTCKMSGSTGENQKKYGGSINGTKYNYTVERFYNKTKKP
ncbi:MULTISPECIES: hypothetical protein [Gordonia]|uniref:Uncharacterized protein n=2 Tax=Gordonia TaxID=2053 RepID=L7LMZ1_9ACTN|nr:MULTISPECIES: hypothetical protein [Gordonia]AUH70049.1 hypothetical protein CXX93_01595 [Gordonia sp. YC-JH1]MBY4569023.1 hypothetical protein [Gordonia sihwensis]WFN93030.1 hypothetical protein P5P27_00105 [Gordonia sihwensis]GAC62106.1 hypothetical protein GSI01S_28_00750 [Gordonia sihwensis NBRC 108236]